MALNDNATLVIGSGNYFSAPVGTPMAADLGAISTPWDSLGHTSLEDIMSIESEGGDKTVLGTLQKQSLRSSFSPRTDSFTILLQQFDTEALRLYYGGNAPTVEGGLVANSRNATPIERAFLAVFVDGNNTFAVYAPKASFFRGDNLEFADTESLASLPLTVTPLYHDDNDWDYAVTPLGTTPGLLDGTPEG